MNPQTQELLIDIEKELEYFDAKPHKISRYKDDFMNLIIKYGVACRAEAMELLKDRLTVEQLDHN